jgi:integrase
VKSGLHPLLVKLSIPRGGFHAARHGATSALIADGATLAVVQKQLRHSDPRIRLGVYAHVIGNQQRDAVENRSARIEQVCSELIQLVSNGDLVSNPNTNAVK